MTNSKFIVVACALVVCLLAIAAARQPSPASILVEYAQGTRAAGQKDYAGAIEHFSRAARLAPSHPGLLAELARAQALAGNRGRAIEVLTRAVALGGGLEVIGDAAVASLLASPEAASLRESVAELRRPIHTSLEAFRVAERDLIPEGLAWDPVDRVFFVSSIYKRKIVRVTPAGQASAFGAGRQDGLFAVLGLRVDPARRVLWAATEATESMEGWKVEDRGRSTLFALDLATGRPLRQFSLAPGPGPHLFNDVVVAPGGDVFFTDSEAGSVYRVSPGAKAPKVLAGPGAYAYPNGITLAGDGRRLFVAHLAGIAVIDCATGKAIELTHPDAISLAEVDGLYRYGHSLVAVQNGLNPVRIVQFMLDDRETRVVSMRILERGHALFDQIPTTGAIADGWFYYIANAQLRAFTPDHRIFPNDRLHEPVILKVPLAPSGGD